MPSSLFGPKAIIPGQGTIANSPGTPQQSNPQVNNSFQPPANLAQIKGLMAMMESCGNPVAMLQSMIATNPQMASVMNFVSRYNGDAKAAFYDLAKQKGVDPNVIIDILK